MDDQAPSFSTDVEVFIKRISYYKVDLILYNTISHQICSRHTQIIDKCQTEQGSLCLEVEFYYKIITISYLISCGANSFFCVKNTLLFLIFTRDMIKNVQPYGHL